MSKRYIIEVHNNLNNSDKFVFIDNGIHAAGDELRGYPALRDFKSFPLPQTLSEKEKDFVIRELKSKRFTYEEDDAKRLPIIITRFGGVVLPNRVADFNIKVYEYTPSQSMDEMISHGMPVLIEAYRVEGVEGQGYDQSDLTDYTIDSLPIAA